MIKIVYNDIIEAEEIEELKNEENMQKEIILKMPSRNKYWWTRWTNRKNWNPIQK